MKLCYILIFLGGLQGYYLSGSTTAQIGESLHYTPHQANLHNSRFEKTNSAQVITVNNWHVNCADWEKSPWFNSKEFIATHDYSLWRFWQLGKWFESSKVEKALINLDFKEKTFTTADGYKLHGYMRTVKNPEFSIIFCSGWMPGRQTGMSTFTQMLPLDNCNIMFFNGRGKGKSTGLGSLLNIFNYGMNEYHDVIAAIKHLNNECPKTPIFLHGICVGSYHAARAVTKLSPQEIAHYNIKGLVIDSGFDSINTIACTMPCNQIKQTFTVPLIRQSLIKIYHCLYGLLYKHQALKKESELTLKDKLANSQIPVLFIHSKNDYDAPYDGCNNDASGIQEVIKTIPEDKKTVWMVEYPQEDALKNRHGVHHLIKKYDYCQKLLEFINRCITRS